MRRGGCDIGVTCSLWDGGFGLVIISCHLIDDT